MHFNRVHIEITNICGLSCSFCPPKIQPSKVMQLDFFEKLLEQLQGLTKELAFHVLGDPLTLSNLEKYLELSHKKNFQVNLTTSGYYLKNNPLETLFHPALRQINISLNSYNKNNLSLSFENYLQNILELCDAKLTHYPNPFINLRLWNLDAEFSEKEFNTKVFQALQNHFGIILDMEKILTEQPKSIRLASKILLHFDNYFEWPSLESNHNTQGSCQALKSHIAILSNGEVVPCCLDAKAIINLGNTHDTPLKDILSSKRVQAMKKGFSEGKAIEELCQKCSYKDRFNCL